MSLARLFLSGLLVAWGLILGAFTLHGYFDPNWPQRQVQAASVRPTHPAVINTFKNRSRFVASRADPTNPSPAPIVKTSAIVAPAADAKAAAKPAPKKKLAEKAKQRSQQASAQWPWSLFGN